MGPMEWRPVDLGWSWLAEPNDYPEIVHAHADSRKIFTRPDWPLPLKVSRSDLVVFEMVINACERFSNGRPLSEIPQFAEPVLFRTCAACQLQEIDWYLYTHCKAQAACETLCLISDLGGIQAVSAEPETSTAFDISRLSLQQRRTRILLLFRALLIAVIFHAALDFGDYVDEGPGSAGARIVLLT